MVNSALSIAHEGYHHDRFEGWYYRLTLPDIQQSLAFMYEVRPNFGASMQVLSLDDRHHYYEFSQWRNFRGNYLTSAIDHRDREVFYSASIRHNRGKIAHISWDYRITSIVPWAKPVMGWLSYLPVCEPYWQILVMHGLAEGSITWQDQTYHFQDAPAYSEKNWGNSFPERWFWLQCNSWQEVEQLSLVATGALRQILGKSSTVAMIALWWQGKWYRFMPDRSQIFCDIAPWGDWYIIAQQGNYRLELQGYSKRPPTPILVPMEHTMQYKCNDTGQGYLQVSLWQGSKRLCHARSSLGALENGGNMGEQNWRFVSETI
jgi:tocopherol cyclase